MGRGGGGAERLQVFKASLASWHYVFSRGEQSHSVSENYTLKMHLLYPEYSFPKVGQWHNYLHAHLQPSFFLKDMSTS